MENGSFLAANAVDGNTGTRWSSAFSDPQWLQVDLGATHAISRVVLNWEAALPVSGSGRYVRMYGTQRATQYGYSLWELQVFGS